MTEQRKPAAAACVLERDAAHHDFLSARHCPGDGRAVRSIDVAGGGDRATAVVVEAGNPTRAADARIRSRNKRIEDVDDHVIRADRSRETWPAAGAARDAPIAAAHIIGLATTSDTVQLVDAAAEKTSRRADSTGDGRLAGSSAENISDADRGIRPGVGDVASRAVGRSLTGNRDECSLRSEGYGECY